MPVYWTENWATNLFIASRCFCSPLRPLVCFHLCRSARQPVSFYDTLNSFLPHSNPSSSIEDCRCFHRVTSSPDCLTSFSPDWHKHIPTPLCWTFLSLLPLLLLFSLFHRLSWQRALSINNIAAAVVCLFQCLGSQSQHCWKGLVCLGHVCKTRWLMVQLRRRVRFQEEISPHMDDVLSQRGAWLRLMIGLIHWLARVLCPRHRQHAGRCKDVPSSFHYILIGHFAQHDNLFYANMTNLKSYLIHKDLCF